MFFILDGYYLIKESLNGGLNNMKCCEDNKDNEENQKHSPIKHMLHMILCCGLPIVIIGFLPLITRFSPSAAVVVARIAPFICPIMMIAMMFMMFGGKKKSKCCDDTKSETENQLNN